MRLAMLTPAWPAGFYPNGIVSYTARQRAALELAGAQVHILSERSGAAEQGVVRLRNGATRTPWQRLRKWVRHRCHGDAAQLMELAEALVKHLWRLHEAHELQLVQMPDTFGLARLVAPRSPVPVVVRLHGPWFLNGSARSGELDERDRQRVEAEGQGIAAAHGVTAPSQSVLERTREHYGMELPEAAVIPNPITVPAPEQLWRLNDCHPRKLLFIGRFDRHKGADLMFEAFARLRRDFNDLQLQFVGPDRGLISDSGREWKLHDYLAHHVPAEAREAIEVLGPQPEQNLAALRRGALVTVVPSRYETFGNTALEAMSFGCPVVTAEVGGLAEIVSDRVTGRTFPPGDAEALATVLGELCEDHAQAQQMGRNAQEHVCREYAPRPIAERTLAFFEGVRERAGGAVREGVST